MTNSEPLPKTTLVLCGTGTTGRRVVARLGSRSAAPPFDWGDRSTWAEAVRGVESAYVVFFPDLVMKGAVDAVGEFAQLAVANGVTRLVLLSGRGEEQAQQAEQVVRQSGADWTIVRSSFFAQNFSEKFFLESILSGTFAFTADTVAEPFIDADDIADVAVAALTQEGHAGRLYEVTGPRLLTFAEAVATISEASGRQVTYRLVSLEEFSTSLIREGVPGEYVAALTEVAGAVLDGRNSYLADGVRRALGREPRDFADYARAAADTGVWRA